MLYKCTHCGVEVERKRKQEIVSCFDCKMERNRKQSTASNNRERAKMIKNLKAEVKDNEKKMETLSGVKEAPEFSRLLWRNDKIIKRLNKFKENEK